MGHEDFYALMMEALDGELASDERRNLDTHLEQCSSCRREWQAILAIDTLFRQAPTLGPAAGFTQRTLARLPERRYRVWLIGLIYGLLLTGGVIPLLLGLWVAGRIGPFLTEPALLRGLLQSLETMWRITLTVLGALFSSSGELLAQQPMIAGWLLVMAGVVFIWSGVYQQVLQQANQA